MNTDIQEAKTRLPLPELMRILGLENHAKKSACSPFRGDKNPSFSVFQKNGLWFWKDHATGNSGDEIDFLGQHEGLQAGPAIKRYLELAGVHANGKSPPPVAHSVPEKPVIIHSVAKIADDIATTWEKAVASFGPADVTQLTSWRGYSIPFVEWLHSQKLVGLHEGHPAFPIHANGQVVGIHYRKTNGTWRVEGGCKMQPFVLGDTKTAGMVCCFESQWDLLAVADKMEVHLGKTPLVGVATRGASNGKMLSPLVENETVLLCFVQNNTPGQKWMDDIVATNPKCTCKLVETPSPHKDPNDWCKAGASSKDIQSAITAATVATPPPSAFPTILDATALIQQDLPRPPELVKGLLHQGSKLVLGGGSKSFKTWCLLDLAISVATGTPWWDFSTVQSRVLYVNLEIQPIFFRDRIQSISKAKNVELKDGQLHIWNLRGHGGEINDLVPRMIESMKDGTYGLMVLDPIYKLLGGRDENSARDITGLLNQLERVAVQTGSAVAWGSHFAKGNASAKESMDRISGSGVFSRDPDSILILTKHEVDDCFALEATLRNLPPVDSVVVRWEFPLMVRDESLDPADLKKAGGRKPEHSVEDILAVLAKQQLKTAEWQKMALDENNISKRTFYRLLADAAKTQKVFKSKITDKWETTK